MSIGGIRDQGQAESLRTELPPRWQVLNSQALVASLEQQAVSDQLSLRFGPGRAADFLRSLPGLVGAMHASGVVLAAIQVLGDVPAFNVLTLALPGARSEGLSKGATVAGEGFSRVKAVMLAHGDAIERRTVSNVWSSSGGLGMPARVQLVFTVPPVSRGAILTLLSSRPGAEDSLAHAAAQIAGSAELLGSESTAKNAFTKRLGSAGDRMGEGPCGQHPVDRRLRH